MVKRLPVIDLGGHWDDSTHFLLAVVCKQEVCADHMSDVFIARQALRAELAEDEVA